MAVSSQTVARRALHPLSHPTVSLLRSSSLLPSVTQCVSELVENSLDAQCTSVNVSVDLTALTLIVKDDGHGIDKQALSLVGQRYHTSKPPSSSLSFGCRGEALASLACLASVAIVSTPVIETRDADGRVRHGSSQYSYHRRLSNTSDATVATLPARSLRPGTTVTVTHLFHSLSVRRAQIIGRKHRELDHIKARVEQLSLIHPAVAFTLVDSECGEHGRVLLHKPRLHTIIDAFSHLYRNELANTLIQLASNDTQSDSEIMVAQLYVSGLAHSPANRDYQFLYINRRPVKHAPFIRCIERIWLLCHRFIHGLPISGNDLTVSVHSSARVKPVVLLQLMLDPRLYDCLAEADKMKFFFQDEGSIIRAIKSTVRAGLQRAYPSLAAKAEELFGGRSDHTVANTNEQHTASPTRAQHNAVLGTREVCHASHSPSRTFGRASTAAGASPTRSHSSDMIDVTHSHSRTIAVAETHSPHRRRAHHQHHAWATNSPPTPATQRSVAPAFIGMRISIDTDSSEQSDSNTRSSANRLHRPQSQSFRSSTPSSDRMQQPCILQTLTTPVFPLPMSISPAPRAPAPLSNDERECIDLFEDINFSSISSSPDDSPLVLSSPSSDFNVDFLYDADDEDEVTEVRPSVVEQPMNATRSPSPPSSQRALQLVQPECGEKRKFTVDLADTLTDSDSDDGEVLVFAKRRRISNARDKSDVEMVENDSAAAAVLDVRAIYERWRAEQPNASDRTFGAMAGDDSALVAHSCNATATVTEVTISKSQLARLSVIGQCERKFILGIVDDLIVAIDQHAADERVRLEVLQSQIDTVIESQPLVRALDLALTSRELAVLRHHEKHFRRWGWQLVLPVNDGNQSHSSVIIHVLAVPRVSRHQLDGEDLREFLSQLAERDIGDISDSDRSALQPRALHRLLVSRSCRHAIMFGDALTFSDMTSLVQKLSQCRLPFQCSHGRPTLAVLVHIHQPHTKQPSQCQQSQQQQRITSKLSAVTLHSVSDER